MVVGGEYLELNVDVLVEGYKEFIVEVIWCLLIWEIDDLVF